MECTHDTCRCEDAPIIQEGQNYCSEHCAGQSPPVEGSPGCGCGHSSCATTDQRLGR